MEIVLALFLQFPCLQLLIAVDPNCTKRPLDIEGCAEECPAEPAQPMPPQAYTKIPRFARDDNSFGNSFGGFVRRIFLHNV
jgi:hypothetical protein